MYDRMYTDDEIQTWLLGRAEIYSQNTQSLYTRYLLYLRTWLAYKGIEPEQLTLINVKEWMDSRGWSQNMRYGASVALRGFFTWRYGVDHPISRIRMRPAKPKPERTLDIDELAGIFEYLARVEHGEINRGRYDHNYRISQKKSVRDKAILAFMVDTGVRSFELCGFLLSNLHIDNLYAMILAKGGEWQEKVFSYETGQLLTSWLELRPGITADNVYNVFVGIGGIRAGYPLTSSGLRVIFRNIARNAGIDQFSPHALRRTMATISILNGAPTRLVQLQGGWKNIQLVERYTQKLKPADFAGYFPISSDVIRSIDVES